MGRSCNFTGLLPSRGASDSDCAYSAQFELELAAKVRNRCSGIVDLKKCFNNIRWICGSNFRKEIGVLTEILRVWILSIASICRFKANTFLQGPLLEVFQRSVVVMVALATAWVCYLVNTIPAPLTAMLIRSYADNWSWALQEVIGHQVAMTNTCYFTQMAGLSIDWSETWFWATANSDARHISDMFVPFSSPHQVLRCLSANDLGYQMQYTRAAQS